jgi:hypothetical protein
MSNGWLDRYPWIAGLLQRDDDEVLGLEPVPAADPEADRALLAVLWPTGWEVRPRPRAEEEPC